MNLLTKYETVVGLPEIKLPGGWSEREEAAVFSGYQSLGPEIILFVIVCCPYGLVASSFGEW